MNTSTNLNPPTEEDVQYLEEFLGSDACSESSMTIAMLDGFLCAIVSGPNAISPSHWLPLVWSSADEPQPPKFESDVQASRLLNTVLGLMNDIVQSLSTEPDEHMLLVDQIETEDGQTVELIDEWCLGYLQGVGLDEESWLPLMMEREDLFATLLIFGTNDHTDHTDDADPTEDSHDVAGAEAPFNKLELSAEALNEFSANLHEVIPEIYAYWLSKRTPIRAEPKLGRNEACHCGSGKKFKHCHALM
jgi:uncharacterized protein